MTNTTDEAVAWMKNQAQHGPAIWQGLCLKDVRTSLGIDSHYLSAADAWEGAHYKHRVSSGHQVPRGVAAFWTGGSSGFGHIVLSVGSGLCYSNDIKRYGHIDLTSIDYITRAWGQHFQGWTEDLNTVHYYTKAGTANAEWAKGEVFVSKLRQGQDDSDSVKRLQYRLMHHTDIPARNVKINGHYGEGTRNAVSHWQRQVAKMKDGPHDGTRLTGRQANRLFGDNYHVIEDD